MSSASWASSSSVSFTRRGVPGGCPAVFFHGWPSSNREQFASDALLERLSLDWFSLNRPGYGETHWRHHHGLLDWPARVAAWADEQGLERFHLVGYSGGGPFAMACAHQIPGRIESLTLIASLAPNGLPVGASGKFLLRRAPAIARAGFSALNAYRKRFPHRVAKRSMQALHPKDQALLNQLNFLPTLQEVQNDAFGQGIHHLVRDLQLYEGAWGFDPAEIQVPTRIYVGGDDVQVPAICSFDLAKAIPNSKLTVYPSEAHYIPFTHAEEILSPIVIT
jgi:pimeloyl-ACP methyl ester carboxylesterase